MVLFSIIKNLQLLCAVFPLIYRLWTQDIEQFETKPFLPRMLSQTTPCLLLKRRYDTT